MVGGRLRCLGSIQHLKSRHGQGYSVQIKLAPVPTQTTASLLKLLWKGGHCRAPLPACGVPSTVAVNPISAEADAGHGAAAVAGAVVLRADLQSACEALGDGKRAAVLSVGGHISADHLCRKLEQHGYLAADALCAWRVHETNSGSISAYLKQAFGSAARLTAQHGQYLTYSLLSSAAGEATDVRASLSEGPSPSRGSQAQARPEGGRGQEQQEEVPRGFTAADIFQALEHAKGAEGVDIEEYAVEQTSIEQIFNSLASRQQEETGRVAGTNFA